MRSYKLIVIFIFVSCSVSQVCAIGISPGRWTNTLPEYVIGDTVLEKAVTLYQDGPYSEVRLLDPIGMDAFFNDDLPTGTSLANENSLVVDWAQVGSSTLNLSYNVLIPDGWTSPTGPGGDRNLPWGLIHQQIADPSQAGIGAILGAVQQFSIYQNYAIRGNVVELQDSYSANTPVQFGLEVKDYASYAMYLERFRIAWSVDWESDGIIDESQSGIQMIGELGETNPSDLVTGFKYKNLDFEHAYSEPGDYLATLYLADSVETTTMQIPINVIPEPATIVLFGLGALFIKKHPILKKGIA